MILDRCKRLVQWVEIHFFSRIWTVEGNGQFKEWTLFHVYICEIWGSSGGLTISKRD